MLRDLVFLSHSSNKKDEKLIDYLCNRAKELGIKLYVAERNPEYEKKVSDKIEEKLESSFCLLVLYTSYASKSRFVSEEIGYTVDAKIPRIFICEKGIKPSAFSYGQELLLLNRKVPKTALEKGLNYIKENETKLKALLPRSPQLAGFEMASYLDYKKETYKEPRFFRPYGPMALDFEKGYVYKRPEVKEIIKKLKNERIVCLTGVPAAGKTVVLHSIGFSLLKNRNSDIYVVPLKETKKPDKDKICSLPQNALVILDDCHLDSSYAEDLVKPPLPKCHLIFSSRPFEPPWFEEERIGTRNELYERMKEAVKIESQDAAEKIIDLFAKKNQLTMTVETITQLKKLYSSNLMLLSWALATFERDNSVGEKKIYEMVKDWLCPCDEIEGFYRDLKEEDRDKINTKKVAEIFVSLSAFYQYETPIDRQFLAKFLNIDDNKESEISILLKSKTISGDIESLGLPHSAIAKLFIKATKETSLLKKIAQGIKSKIKINYGDLTWDNALVYSYMWQFPEKGEDLLFLLRTEVTDTFYKLVELPDYPYLQKKIFETVEHFSFFSWFYISRDIAQEITSHKLKQINKVMNQIESKKFEERVINWANPGDIGNLLGTLNLTYPRISGLLKNINQSVLLEKIKNWDGLWDIAYLLKTLNEAGYIGIKKLLNSLPPLSLKEKIVKCNDIWQIAYFLGTFKAIGYGKIDELLENFEPHIFEGKIKKCYDIGNIIHFLEILNGMNFPYRFGFLEALNYKRINEFEPAIFEEKIEKSDNLWDISRLLRTLKEISYKRINELKLSFFKKKIKELTIPPDNIIYLFVVLEEINYNKINELLERIGPSIFIEKTKEYNMLWDIRKLGILKKMGYKKFDELLQKLKPEFLVKIINLWDKEDREECLTTLKDLNYPHLRRLKDIIQLSGRFKR